MNELINGVRELTIKLLATFTLLCHSRRIIMSLRRSTHLALVMVGISKSVLEIRGRFCDYPPL